MLPPAWAQTPPQIPGLDLPGVPPPGLPIGTPPVSPSEEEEGGEPGAPQPINVGTPEQQKRMMELAKLKLDRRPAAILEAQQKLISRPAAIESSAEAFQCYVAGGRWEAIGEYLATFPAPAPEKLFESVLQRLLQPPEEEGNQNRYAPPPPVTLLPGDILVLADAAPGDLTGAQLKVLGGLLGRTFESNGGLEDLLRALEKGTKRLGGSDPAKREAAAQLLLDAGRAAEAVHFLPAVKVGGKASPGVLEKHVLCALHATGDEPKAGAATKRAWDLNAMIWRDESAPEEFRQRAWERCAALARTLPPAAVTAWAQESLPRKTVPALLAVVAKQVTTDRVSNDAELRGRNLALQRQVLAAVVTAGDQRAAWQGAVDLFALNWLREAEVSKQADSNDGQPYYNANVRGQGRAAQQRYYNNNNQFPPVPPAELLASAPDGEWLAVVDPGLQPKIIAMLADLWLKSHEEQKALPWIEKLAPLQPAESLRLANDLLMGWMNLRQQQLQMQANRGYQYGNQGGQGIPLTRALQKRNLDELAGLLERLRKLPIEALNDDVVVEAFAVAHSPAEVYREESIERVLGKVDTLKPETRWTLLHAMRQRLAMQWRQQRVQQMANTRRTDAQVEAEVLRGYELLGGIIEQGLKREPEDWQLNLAKAATTYDWAEFQYGKKVDLAIYVEKREVAFNSFQRAADSYAALVAKGAMKEESPLVYQMWLNANLGASDLAMVTRQQEPSAGHIERIRKAMDALPEGAADRHREALAKAVMESTPQMPGHLKPNYMRSALTVIGNRPAAAELQKLVSYYDSLLQEVETVLRVDGDGIVGHGSPFGVFFSIRHTADLERENAVGFGKYLRNQTQNYGQQGLAPIDHRDQLEKQIREKLSEGFEISSLTFHDENVESRGYGRPGWRETPLVYLVLKAKDASIDRLPSIRLDLDFLDVYGPVVLPVISPVQLIDARPEKAATRPFSELELAPVLDARGIGEGKLALEMKATAKGIVPDFKELFDFAPAGLKIDETTDSGPVVTRFDSKSEALAGVSERTWIVKMSVNPGAGTPAAFQFPTAKQPVAKVVYKRYEDADLLEVPPKVALQGLPLREASRWPWYAGGAAALFLIALVVIWSRRRPAVTAAAGVFQMPATVTPFTILGLLRRIEAERGAGLPTELRGELTKTISDLETRSFAPNAAGATEADLVSLTRRWIEMARV